MSLVDRISDVIKEIAKDFSKLGTASTRDVGDGDDQIPLSRDVYTNKQVQSRGMNLVTNGTCLLKNNYNFSNFTYYPSDSYTGGGSFLAEKRYFSGDTDELIPVIPSKFYTLNMYLKSIVSEDRPIEERNCRIYPYVTCYDIDEEIIYPSHYTWDDNVTTLTQDLNVGDTIIHVEDASGFRDRKKRSDSHTYIKIHEYVDGTGKVWGEKTYSRNTHSRNAYNSENDVDVDNNTITLSRYKWNRPNPNHPDGTWLAGTRIGTCFSGGTYKYVTQKNNFPLPSDKWTLASGIIGGITTDGGLDNNTFVYGTAFIKIGLLANRPYSTNRDDYSYSTTNNKTLVSAVYLSEVTHKNLNEVDTKLIKSKSLNESGWYTIATNYSTRAYGDFVLTEVTSGCHQSISFKASYHYGNKPTINVLMKSQYSGMPITRLRIKTKGTYDGALLQIYCNRSKAQIYRLQLKNNLQSSGWELLSEPILENSDKEAEIVNPKIRIGDASKLLYEHAVYLNRDCGSYFSRGLETSNLFLTNNTITFMHTEDGVNETNLPQMWYDSENKIYHLTQDMPNKAQGNANLKIGSLQCGDEAPKIKFKYLEGISHAESELNQIKLISHGLALENIISCEVNIYVNKEDDVSLVPSGYQQEGYYFTSGVIPDGVFIKLYDGTTPESEYSSNKITDSKIKILLKYKAN